VAFDVISGQFVPVIGAIFALGLFESRDGFCDVGHLEGRPGVSGMTALSTMRRSFPTFWLLAGPFRWIGKSRGRVYGLVSVVVSILAIPSLWWATQLWELPDIGEPFDVKVFREMTIPGDRNAFAHYQEAARRFKPMNTSGGSSLPAGAQTAWSATSAEVRQWAGANREALDLFRLGSERPDALDVLRSMLEEYMEFDRIRTLEGLALLEASRRQEMGDMAGAWRWYRTYLRTIHLVGSHAKFQRRWEAQQWHDRLRQRARGWAADARTTPALLRQALDDVIACEAISRSDSYTIKAEYLTLEEILGGDSDPARYTPPSWLETVSSWSAVRYLGPLLTPDQVRSITDGWRFWRREPERSRRVIRMVTANRLAYYDLPPARRPGAVASVARTDLYPFGPEAPAKARAVSPRTLALWFASTHEAWLLVEPLELSGIQIKELTNHRKLVIQLASELYRRDHGSNPPAPEALVGPYLKCLPREFPEEGSDQKSQQEEPVVD
jgi:hypothetical protein